MRFVDLIIFDLDGTLVDSKKAIANSANFALKKLGLRIKNQDEIDSYIGRGLEELVKDFLDDRQELFEEAITFFQKNFMERSAKNSSLYPGIKEALDFFENKKMAIITNRLHKFAQLVLNDFGIRHYFKDIMGGDDIKCVKPSSCPLNKIICKLKANKGSTIMVGDMHYDVLAGKEAGTLTCAVTYGIGKKEDIRKAGPDYMIDEISELKNIIK